jgi:hypothetical protein
MAALAPFSADMRGTWVKIGLSKIIKYFQFVPVEELPPADIPSNKPWTAMCQ